MLNCYTVVTYFTVLTSNLQEFSCTVTWCHIRESRHRTWRLV